MFLKNLDKDQKFLADKKIINYTLLIYVLNIENIIENLNYQDNDLLINISKYKSKVMKSTD